MAKIISNRSRHIRWNWEQSSENSELVRYHFVVVDDKDRSGILRRVIEQLSRWGDLIPIRELEGKVIGSKHRYLFVTYDTQTAPREIDFSKVRKPVKKDLDLRERLRGNIEDYVAEIYE